jgi:hypothetical protein
MPVVSRRFSDEQQWRASTLSPPSLSGVERHPAQLFVRDVSIPFEVVGAARQRKFPADQ